MARAPGMAWRILSPIGAVLAALVAAMVLYAVLLATPMSEDAITAVVQPLSGLLILVFAYLLWRHLPRLERDWVVARKGSIAAAIGLGLAVGIGCVITAGTIIAIGQAVDPTVERRLEELEDELSLGSSVWQIVLLGIALIVLAPLGEELLFRGLLLRGLTRRFRFWPAAILSAVIFAGGHFDAYVLWPRAVGLVAVGILLAWLYRWRGYWASVTAHATVNTVAFIALVASSASS